MVTRGHGLDAAYETCARLAREHYENFPVASWLLPRSMRPHVAAVYAFARVADDFADEGERQESERLRLLDAWLARLRTAAADDTWRTAEPLWREPPSLRTAEPSWRTPPCLPPAEPLWRTPPCLPPAEPLWRKPPCLRPADEAAGEPPHSGLPAETPHIFAALGSTIRTCGLPLGLFEDLLSAFRQDVTTRRYDDWGQVIDYCRRSANPVGRLVLGIAGYRDERLARSSDAVCTALQLTNFWQDFSGDWQKGRLYLPLDECRRAGARLADLDARRITPEWRQVLRQAVERTARLFEDGRYVCDGVSGRLRWELRLTWLGGRRVLARLEGADYDVFHGRPTIGVADAAALFWQVLTWRTR